MRKISLLCAAIILVAQSSVAYAVYYHPHAIIDSIDSGKPMEFSGKAFGRKGDTHIAVWYSGASEERNLDRLKAKFSATVDIAEGGETLRLKTKFMAYQRQAYFMLESVEGSLAGETMPEFLRPLYKQWVTYPIDESLYYDLLEANDSINGVDDILTLEHAKFSGGYAYSMRLSNPAMNALLAMLKSHFDVEDFVFLQGEKPLNFHMKVDTNEDHQFRFLRAHLSVDLPEEDFRFSTEVEAQHRPAPVYLDIPKNARHAEHVLSDLLDAVFFDLHLSADLGFLGSEELYMDMGWDETFEMEEADRIRTQGRMGDPMIVGEDFIEELRWSRRLDSFGTVHMPGSRLEAAVSRTYRDERRNQLYTLPEIQVELEDVIRGRSGFNRPSRRFVERNSRIQERERARVRAQRLREIERNRVHPKPITQEHELEEADRRFWEGDY